MTTFPADEAELGTPFFCLCLPWHEGMCTGGAGRNAGVLPGGKGQTEPEWPHLITVELLGFE